VAARRRTSRGPVARGRVLRAVCVLQRRYSQIHVCPDTIALEAHRSPFRARRAGSPTPPVWLPMLDVPFVRLDTHALRALRCQSRALRVGLAQRRACRVVSARGHASKDITARRAAQATPPEYALRGGSTPTLVARVRPHARLAQSDNGARQESPHRTIARRGDSGTRQLKRVLRVPDPARLAISVWRAARPVRPAFALRGRSTPCPAARAWPLVKSARLAKHARWALRCQSRAPRAVSVRRQDRRIVIHARVRASRDITARRAAQATPPESAL